jgi:hypothetical protein
VTHRWREQDSNFRSLDAEGRLSIIGSRAAREAIAGSDPAARPDFILLGPVLICHPMANCRAAARPSHKVPDTHSVCSICDDDFGVFTVTNIATENTDAVSPAHPVPRMPKAANRGCKGAAGRECR